MKKIFISLLAVAALAACTKSEVEYTPAGEISFAPVAKNVTKSVAGYNGDIFDGVFPTDIDLYVFANAVEGTYSSTNVGDAYFQNALFEWSSSKGSEDTQGTVATKGAYAGNPTRYWPNVKTLVFAGYSDACNVASLATKPAMNFATNELTITGYTQDNTKTAEGANDLMWFACDERAYPKQADEIAANMQHACSWITINVYGDANMVASGCKLNGLDVLNLFHTGTAVCGKSSAAWTTSDTASDEAYYTNTTGVAVTDAATKYEPDTKNNFIVIPQTPTDLNVTYTYTSDSTNGLTLKETKSVSLKYNGDEKWESGVHYIYNVKITATEILIDPVVVDWTAYTGNNIEKTVQ